MSADRALSNPLVQHKIMFSLKWSAVLLFCCLTNPLLAAENDTPEFLIKRMIAATSALNYEGVFVYQRGDQIDSMRILHRVNGETEYERLVSLSGPPREVVRKGTEVRCLFPDDKEGMVGKVEPKDFLTFSLLTSVDTITNHYRLKLSGRARIAGREARTVSIIPIENNRYAYLLAVDSEFGLLLKSAIFGSSGRVLEQVQFANITIGHEIPMRDFEPEISGESFTWRTSENDSSPSSPPPKGSAWRAEWLPAGFEMRNHMVQRYASNSPPVSHMVYSDGLAMVSIFIETRTGNALPSINSHSSMGAVNALSRVMDDHQVTVVGEVPVNTLQKIAASVSEVR